VRRLDAVQLGLALLCCVESQLEACHYSQSCYSAGKSAVYLSASGSEPSAPTGVVFWAAACYVGVALGTKRDYACLSYCCALACREVKSTNNKGFSYIEC
jgi:hypothetical protein